MRCPRCGTLLAQNEQSCPECGLGFIAGDRPGIRIAVAPKGEFLCERCAYREDCNLPDCPKAQRCSLYRDAQAPKEAPPIYQSPLSRRLWSVPLLLLLLLLISWLLALRH
ncbi:hypothetical protein [Gloeobacter kilaueensis]|uniref:DZANK-type domain-containing protein n=1 Tax=Gloeobacter kilaueensis (strain ATCC BAA-2537 / CCAP 1431/1 / ULC 316 / JS1) TaxID=1183438 RepID=U5QP56_GLOK1|nr:hypothetical protein [Gloeobacter kilaueensis]AGY59435.1 hypothetical protein GKIL_3189 [Gloeobacter kilaueensis JS1]